METVVLNKTTIMTVLRQHRETLRQYGIQEIGLFGSFVRNEGKPDSDIDLPVRFFAGQKTFDNLMELSFFLRKTFSKKSRVGDT